MLYNDISCLSSIYLSKFYTINRYERFDYKMNDIIVIISNIIVFINLSINLSIIVPIIISIIIKNIIIKIYY